MAPMHFRALIAVAIISGLGSMFTPYPGQAAEHPIFRASFEVLDNPVLRPIDDYLQNTLEFLKTTSSIASTDLNYDGIPEYIVRSCSHSKMCRFHVLALTATKTDPVRSLGHMSGHNLQISDVSDYGVRRLMVQDKELNDFAVTYYSWDAKQSHYTQHEAP